MLIDSYKRCTNSSNFKTTYGIESSVKSLKNLTTNELSFSRLLLFSSTLYVDILVVDY